jgi:hypothetical protein
MRSAGEQRSKRGRAAQTVETTARCALRRNAVSGGMPDLADAGRVVATDALRGSKRFGAIEASAQAAVRRIRGRETTERGGGDLAERGIGAGLGIPVDEGNGGKGFV